jgi:hypothetical protein
VGDVQITGSEAADAEFQHTPRRDRWHQRPSIRKLKKRAENEDREFTRKWDERDNAETRLPLSEQVQLGGLVLTEAFTPSTVSSLSAYPLRSDRRHI